MCDNLAPNFWDSIYHNFDNEICKECYRKAKYSMLNLGRPCPLPYVGRNFSKDEKRLMFVGIESYSSQPRESIDDLTYDIFETEQIQNLYFGKKESGVKYSPFWEWVRRISTQILAPQNLDYKDQLEYAFPRFAYSNLHKCQNWKANHDSNSSTYHLFEPLSRYCIQRNRWIYEEIEAVDPKHVIVFAGTKSLRDKKFFLSRLFLDKEGGDLTTYKYSSASRWQKRNGKDLLLKVESNRRRLIVASHPQGSPNDLRDEIVRIIKENDC